MWRNLWKAWCLSLIHIYVSVPDLCIDMGGAILSVPLSRFLRLSEDVLLIENVFHLGERSFFCRILFMPEMDSLKAMFETLGVQ